MFINTGTYRSITGHAISGGLFSLMCAGAANYAQYKKGQIDKKRALKQTTQSTLQGAIITAAAIGATNAIGKNNDDSPTHLALEAISFVAAGALAAYTINKVFADESSCEQITQKSDIGEENESDS